MKTTPLASWIRTMLALIACLALATGAMAQSPGPSTPPEEPEDVPAEPGEEEPEDPGEEWTTDEEEKAPAPGEEEKAPASEEEKAPAEEEKPAPPKEEKPKPAPPDEETRPPSRPEDGGGLRPVPPAPFPPDGEFKPVSKGLVQRISVELQGFVSVPSAGDAGSGNGAPGYADAFGAGTGVNLRIGLTRSPALAWRLDLGTVSYPGKEFDSLGSVNRFSDLSGMYLMIGFDYFFFLGNKETAWFDSRTANPFEGLALRLAIRGGVLFNEEVTWARPRPEWAYWESSTAVLFSVWAGADYRFRFGLGILLGVEATYAGPPSAAEPSGTRASATGMMATAVTLGVGYHF